MKKIGLLLGSVILAASLVGCGEKKAETTAATAEKLPIGLTAYKFDDNFIAQSNICLASNTLIFPFISS